MKESRPFQFRLATLFLLTTEIAVLIAIVKGLANSRVAVLGLAPVEVAVVGVVAILLFGSKLPPPRWR